ncbi:hypothetical protein [Desulfobaculum bizertense]|uniref:Transglutaminase-like superfamily protein n=1 Tax=Desulfobaculum bizertense DSM 18034 TaxID=1121442 RepID=A0A1T4WPM0_9BACT|nr:hypothetical protein [Desulfobaculum bizertense]UIJ39248.1 hypothetical protein LWC08_06665 [Desulfobaculum bizertense]SKA79312.1 hypothetical protein SAMN02745702_02535 [Desulfobaculum bizertense DSM 18034]
MFDRKPTSFESCLEAASENTRVEVVHGWIWKEEQWEAHAWCEFDDRVIDLTESRHSMPKFDFYVKFKVDPKRCKRYTRLHFFELVGDEGHFGPFDKEFFFAASSATDPLERLQ